MRCTCGGEYKGYRGLSQHWHRGCPDAIVELFMEGRSMLELATKFNKSLEKIQVVIRRAAIEHELKRKGKS